MNKKILFGVAAMGILGLVGTGVGLSNVGPAMETKADDPVKSNIFIAGDMNGWLGNGEDNVELSDIQTNPEYQQYRFDYIRTDNYGSSYYTLTFELSNGQSFGIRDWENGHSKWCVYYNPSTVYYGLSKNGEGNYLCTLSGTYQITYRYKDSNDKQIERFEMVSDYKDIYVINNGSWTSLFAHSWKYNPESTVDYTYWGNCVITKQTAVTIGSSNYEFYRLRVKNDANKIIIGGAGDKKTADLDAVNAMCILTGDADANLSAAGAIVGNILAYMDEAEHNGTTYLNSICAIPSDKASGIVAAYDGAGDDVKAILANSPITTHNPENYASQTPVAISAIRDQLAKTPSSALKLSFESNGQDVAPIAVGIVAGTALAIGGLFLLRKKRAE